MKNLFQILLVITFASYLFISCSETIEPNENSPPQYVNYFPFKIGSKWQYNGRYHPPGDFVWYDYEGEELWELADLANDSSWFIIVTDFTGLKIKKIWGSPIDTTYLYNEISELTINNIKGILSFKSVTGSEVSLLRWFFYVKNDRFTEFKITYPLNSADTINVLMEDGQDYLRYTIIKNVGFDTLSVTYFNPEPTVTTAYLELQDYYLP